MSEPAITKRNSGICESAPSRTIILACRVLERELAMLAADLPDPPAIHWLEQGLHNDPPKLQATLQQKIDQLERDSQVARFVLAYGLCSRGVEGLTTQQADLIVPRSHDCIALLMGSRAKHEAYLADNPGTYWYSVGWNACHTPPGEARYNKLRSEYVAKYGEDNADYLMEMEQEWFRTYSRATYIATHTGNDDEQAAYTRACADWLDWQFDQVTGDLDWLRQLLTGPWHDDERFLIVPPGARVKAVADERVITAVTIEGDPTP